MKIFLFLLICLTIFEFTYQRPYEQIRSRSADDDDDFDYLVLRQIWPVTSCMFPGEHECIVAKNITTWVVHGLWLELNY
jgi:hypothetical protein